MNAPARPPFEDYPVMGAYNDPTGPRGNQVTVHFPAAGVYPYELDYSECCGGELSMTMTSQRHRHSAGRQPEPDARARCPPSRPAIR